jgi:hypothetical protein
MQINWILKHLPHVLLQKMASFVCIANPKYPLRRWNENIQSGGESEVARCGWIQTRDSALKDNWKILIPKLF